MTMGTGIGMMQLQAKEHLERLEDRVAIDSHSEPFEGAHPYDALVLHFGLPELWENKLPLSYANKSMAICYSNYGKLIESKNT